MVRTLNLNALRTMALVRTITVVVKVSASKTQTLTENVPAEWISGNRPARTELLENERVRTRIDVNPEYLISAQIGEPWDPEQNVGFLVG